MYTVAAENIICILKYLTVTLMLRTFKAILNKKVNCRVGTVSNYGAVTGRTRLSDATGPGRKGREANASNMSF